MLSRTASNLYWMARYLERAESTARLLDACFQPGMPYAGDLDKLRALPLHIQSAYADFALTGTALSIEAVSKFMISGNTQASIRNSLELARENARSERSRLSSEVWEAINQTWIEFQEMQHKPLAIFTDWLRQRAFIFQGAVSITMPENLSLHFLRLGLYIERADQTLRILEAKLVLDSLTDYSDYYHWIMILRAVSSFEAYQETIAATPSHDRVFKFLLFNKTVPRSVRYCIAKIQDLIELIRAEKRRPSLKVCGSLFLKLRCDEWTDIVDIGQSDYIQMLQDEVAELATSIHKGYFVTV